MGATLVELAVEGGLPTLRCPVTGEVVFDEERGFDETRTHGPYLRFFVDWVGQLFIARGEGLPEHQDAYIETVARLWIDHPQEQTIHALMETARTYLPASALILEVHDPPRGAYEGEMCYVCFDFEPLEETHPVRLVHVAH